MDSGEFRLGLCIRMRIAIWHNLPSGGGKRACYDQVRGLLSRGHEIEVWCPPTADRKFLPLDALVQEHVVPLAEFPKKAEGRLRRWWQSFRDLPGEMRIMEEHCRSCGEQMAEGGFDLLLVHPCRFFLTSAVAKYAGLPGVLYLQEPNRGLYEALPRLPWEAPPRVPLGLSRAQWKVFFSGTVTLHQQRVQVREERAWAVSFDQILVNSQFSRESVLRAYNLDSRVCYLGIDVESFRPTGERKEAVVIGLGNVYPHKRVSLAIEAIGAIPRESRPPLVWIGNGVSAEYAAAMKSLAEERNVEFSMKLLVSEEELRGWLSRAAVMLYTSHLEPFGYAPLEANACGTGVVAIAEGGVRETVDAGVNGMLVANADPEALAREVVRFTSDLEFAEGFGQRARRHVEETWSVHKGTDRLEQELLRCVQTSGRRVSPSEAALS